MTIWIKLKPKRLNDTSESSKSVGTVKELVGKICVLSVFVAPYHNPWKPEDIVRQQQKVIVAERWLKMQALRYKKNVEFFNLVFGQDGSLLDNDIPLTCDSPQAYFYPSKLLYKALKVGFQNTDAFMEWVKDNTGCSQCLAIVFSNTKGRSFASPVSKELYAYNPHLFNLEGCFLFRYYTDSEIETKTATIAHEMLHLFGAWDLYELDDADHNRAIKTSVMFPQSIMLDTHRDIWETQIDQINAWLVGLTEEGEDWYRWFEPHQESYESD